jgi:equilibrative nucleoside transporter 1/2/3
VNKNTIVLFIAMPDLDHLSKCAVFLLFGIAMLMPWNSWITITSYFKHRLAHSPFADNFQSYISLTFMITNIITLLLLIRFRRIDQNVRIIGGFCMTAIVFSSAAAMPAFAKMDTVVYFNITLFLVFLSSVAASLLAGVFGLVINYPAACMTFLTSGQGYYNLMQVLAVLFQPLLILFC